MFRRVWAALEKDPQTKEKILISVALAEVSAVSKTTERVYKNSASTKGEGKRKPQKVT